MPSYRMHVELQDRNGGIQVRSSNELDERQAGAFIENFRDRDFRRRHGVISCWLTRDDQRLPIWHEPSR